MIITICGSMEFHKEMRTVKKLLEEKGYKVLVPKSIELIDFKGYRTPKNEDEKIMHKIEYDFIREHF